MSNTDWKEKLQHNVMNRITSKKIKSFEDVVALFRGYHHILFFDSTNKYDPLIKIETHENEVYFYIDNYSIGLISGTSEIAVIFGDSNEHVANAVIKFDGDYSYIKYLDKNKLHYLCNDELDKLYMKAFSKLINN